MVDDGWNGCFSGTDLLEQSDDEMEHGHGTRSVIHEEYKKYSVLRTKRTQLLFHYHISNKTILMN